MNIFIEDMATQRKGIQRDRLQHLDMQLMQTNAHLDEVREHRDTLSRQQQKQLDKGGVTGDKYRSTLASIVNAKSEIDAKTTDYAGIQDQIEALTRSIADTYNREKDLETGLK